MKKALFILLTLFLGLFVRCQVQIVTLNGIGSDSDGTVSKTEWFALSANPSATVFGTPLVTYTTAVKSVTHQTTVVPAGGAQWVAGVYKFVFRVTDNGSAVSSDTMQVTFKTNVAPKANAGADQTITVNQVATIGATDIGKDLAIHWRRIMGNGGYYIQSPSSTTTRVYGLRAGTHLFEKTIWNSAGSSRDYVQVIVKR